MNPENSFFTPRIWFQDIINLPVNFFFHALHISLGVNSVFHVCSLELERENGPRAREGWEAHTIGILRWRSRGVRASILGSSP